MPHKYITFINYIYINTITNRNAHTHTHIIIGVTMTPSPTNLEYICVYKCLHAHVCLYVCVVCAHEYIISTNLYFIFLYHLICINIIHV